MSDKKKELFDKVDLSWETVKDLNVDSDYQRPVKLDMVQKIVDNFNPSAFGVPQVSQRSDKTLWILDAQQRCAAMRRMDRADDLVPCLVHHDLTKKEEAQLFLDLNQNKGVSIYEKYRARVTAGDPVAVDIESIITSLVLKTWSSPSTGTISAVGACEKVYRGHGSRVRSKCPEVFRETLEVIVTAWEPTKSALSGQMILGIGTMLIRHGAKVDLDRLKAKLRLHQYASPGLLVAEAKTNAHVNKRSVADCVASTMVDIYNKGLSTNKLDSWKR